MKLGMPVLAECTSVGECIDVCRRLKLDFIELNADFAYCLPGKIDWATLRNCRDIFFTVHLSETVEVGALYEPARKFAVELVKDLAGQYNKNGGIKKFNLHLDQGVFQTLPQGRVFMFEKYKDDYLASINKSLKELSDFAVENRIEFCFENVNTPPYVLEAFSLVIKYPNLFYTLDIGHNARYGGTAEPFFMKTPSKVKHMHLHDWDGVHDHCELGTGIINVRKYLDFAKTHDITVDIEVKREKELAKSVAAAQ